MTPIEFDSGGDQGQQLGVFPLNEYHFGADFRSGKRTGPVLAKLKAGMPVFGFIKNLGDGVEFVSNFATMADTTGSVWERAKTHSIRQLKDCPRWWEHGLQETTLAVMKHRRAVGSVIGNLPCAVLRNQWCGLRQGW